MPRFTSLPGKGVGTERSKEDDSSTSSPALFPDNLRDFHVNDLPDPNPLQTIRCPVINSRNYRSSTICQYSSKKTNVFMVHSSTDTCHFLKSSPISLQRLLLFLISQSSLLHDHWMCLGMRSLKEAPCLILYWQRQASKQVIGLYSRRKAKYSIPDIHMHWHDMDKRSLTVWNGDRERRWASVQDHAPYLSLNVLCFFLR